MTLESLPLHYRAAVFGASGGLGAALVRALCADERCGAVYAGSRAEVSGSPPKARPFKFDLLEETSIAAAAQMIATGGPLHLVLIATGVLHDGALQPEKTWGSISSEALHTAFAINVIGPALIAKHLLGGLASGERAVFAALSARVGSTSDNRLGGWHAYRASKAALNMLVKNLSIELTRRNPTALCVALHPGTVDTALSRPFQANVRPDTLFSPDRSAALLLGVIDRLEAAQSGALLAWDGSAIPY